VKSLLLGSAAGVVVVAGAQAADLPVKAKAVEYVKICSLYGAGFFYIPGTDICLKVGGYVRYQADWGAGNSITAGPIAGTGGINTRTGDVDFIQRARAIATFDTRSASQYGVVRTYLVLGVTQDTNTTTGPTNNPSNYATRAFIQFAGFTFGKTQSFFDIVPTATFTYNGGMLAAPDTGDLGVVVATYTANFGGGVSLSIGAEQARSNPTAAAPNVFTGTAGAYAFGAQPTGNALGGANPSVPDIVANLRVDQAWGTLMGAFALHEVGGGYYGTTENLGHPSNVWGWAATGGFIFNLPMIAPGDRLAASFQYAQGAGRYTNFTPGGSGMLSWQGGSLGWGMNEDSVYQIAGTGPGGVASGSLQLTTAWSVVGAFEHLWTPALRTSIYGSYFKETHNAEAAALICANGITSVGALGTPATGCNPDYSFWGIGSRTQWEPVRNLYIGVDVMYQKLNTATVAGNAITTTAAIGAKEIATYAVSNQSAWVAAFRVERQIVP